MIKYTQKIDPSKKGDPASLKFQQQYVESCDEAEKELIYQSAFHSFVTMSNWSSIFLVLAMIMHLLWNTGITAIIFVGVLQLLQTLSYLKFCVTKKGQKLNR